MKPRVLYGVFVVGEIFFMKNKSHDWPKKYYYIFSALIVLFEFLNLKCHQVLKNLRVGSDGKVDPHKRGIPDVRPGSPRAGASAACTAPIIPGKYSSGSHTPS